MNEVACTKLSLVVVSQIKNHEDLAEAISLEADHHWTKGQTGSNQSPGPRVNGVEYMSGLSISTDLTEHISGLIARLQPVEERLRRLAETLLDEEGGLGGLRVWASITSAEGTLGLNFDNSALAFLASIHADLGIQLYFDDEDGS